MNKTAILCSTILVLLLLGGCTQTTTKIEDPNYPAPVRQNYNPGYPAESSAPETAVVPSLVPNTGIVYGVIEYQGKALAQATFFLADVLKNDEGDEIATSLDRGTAPMSVTDANGVLKFYNVKPGRYGLILADGMNTYLLLYPDNGNAILLTVQGGDEIDLGDIKFSDLPLD